MNCSILSEIVCRIAYQNLAISYIGRIIKLSSILLIILIFDLLHGVIKLLWNINIPIMFNLYLAQGSSKGKCGSLSLPRGQTFARAILLLIYRVWSNVWVIHFPIPCLCLSLYDECLICIPLYSISLYGYSLYRKLTYLWALCLAAVPIQVIRSWPISNHHLPDWTLFCIFRMMIS